MSLPETLDVQAALIYFHAYMYGPYKGRVRLFRQRGMGKGERHPSVAHSGWRSRLRTAGRRACPTSNSR